MFALTRDRTDYDPTHGPMDPRTAGPRNRQAVPDDAFRLPAGARTNCPVDTSAGRGVREQVSRPCVLDDLAIRRTESTEFTLGHDGPDPSEACAVVMWSQ